MELNQIAMFIASLYVKPVAWFCREIKYIVGGRPLI